MPFSTIFVVNPGSPGLESSGHGVKYAVVGKDGSLEWKTQSGFQCADDVCLMATNEDLNVIMEKVNESVIEYGLTVNEKKTQVVCINCEVGRRR